VGLEPTTYGLKVPRNPRLLVYLLYKNRATWCSAMPPRAITYRLDFVPRNAAVHVMPVLTVRIATDENTPSTHKPRDRSTSRVCAFLAAAVILH
jgi:hypothetical protein